MDLEVIRVFFKTGQLLALTPSSFENKTPSSFQKLYLFVLLLLSTYFSAVLSYHREPRYAAMAPLTGLLWRLNDVIRYLHNFYILVGAMTVKREKWFQMIDSLKQTEYAMRPRRYISTMVLWYLVLASLLACMIRICIFFLGRNCPEQYVIEFFQWYSQFFYMFLGYQILAIVKSRYNHQRRQMRLTPKLHVLKYLKKFKRNICLLKRAVDAFNEIFGGSILLNVVLASLKLLIYITNMMKTNLSPFGLEITIMSLVSQIGMMLFLWVHIVYLLLMCDAILVKFDAIFAAVCRFEATESTEVVLEDEYLQDFVEFLQHNGPIFYAARFFTLTRATIFHILNSLTTFLLVLIQVQ